MKCLHVWSWGRWACLLAALGCWQGRAQDDIEASPRDVDLAPDQGSNVEGMQAIESLDGVDGEDFSHIWGASGDLWVIGAPVNLSYGLQENIPGIHLCRPDYWDADVVVRRNTGDGWRDMHVPATTSLRSLHGSDARNVWAVGLNGAAVQFDGSGWLEHDVRSAKGLEFEGSDPCAELSLHSVFARSDNDVWAVGYINPSSLGPGLILHYDGVKWERHPTGAPDGFFSVWAASESDAWAVGASGILHHFDGTSWAPVAAKTSQYLWSVWGTSAADVWATGNMAVMTRFDGSAWELVQSERPHEERRSLTGTAAAGLWTLANKSTTDGSIGQALLHWADGSWQEQASFPSMLRGIWVTPEGELWGAGGQLVCRFR